MTSIGNQMVQTQLLYLVSLQYNFYHLFGLRFTWIFQVFLQLLFKHPTYRQRCLDCNSKLFQYSYIYHHFVYNHHHMFRLCVYTWLQHLKLIWFLAVLNNVINSFKVITAYCYFFKYDITDYLFSFAVNSSPQVPFMSLNLIRIS